MAWKERSDENLFDKPTSTYIGIDWANMLIRLSDCPEECDAWYFEPKEARKIAEDLIAMANEIDDFTAGAE